MSTLVRGTKAKPTTPSINPSHGIGGNFLRQILTDKGICASESLEALTAFPLTTSANHKGEILTFLDVGAHGADVSTTGKQPYSHTDSHTESPIDTAHSFAATFISHSGMRCTVAQKFICARPEVA